MMPARVVIGHRFTWSADYRAALFLDGTRWPDNPAGRSIRSPAFAKADQLARRFLQHRLAWTRQHAA